MMAARLEKRRADCKCFCGTPREFYFPTFGRKNFEYKFTPVILLLLQCKLGAMKVKSR